VVLFVWLFDCLMVFNVTFNNISVISWRSVLLVEETGGLGENHWPATSHIMLYRVHLAWAGFELTTLEVIGTYCIGSYKSNHYDGPWEKRNKIKWLKREDTALFLFYWNHNPVTTITSNENSAKSIISKTHKQEVINAYGLHRWSSEHVFLI
jgi:hypothetical protein